MKKITVGQEVKVMNQRLDGTQIIEGFATVKEIVEEMPDGYVARQVKFENDDMLVFRWIDLAIQTPVPARLTG